MMEILFCVRINVVNLLCSLKKYVVATFYHYVEVEFIN